ncbi:sensor histidine kinase [Cellulomonas timonensis]|uniref:sensor histidine kinase n=1 Tax=Cellulomonas timonensis TaxID=1689271 RepID=UPI000AA5F779|nr:HAMP domain-containing sensor histidine kinase [Cellulomonas timonensis]
MTRRYRATVRTRLALTCAALLTGAGVVMLAIVNLFMRVVPTYDLVSATSSTPALTAPPSVTEPVPDGVEPTAAAIATPANELVVTSTDQLLNVLLIASVVVLLVLAVIGVAVGWVVAGRMLKPLKHISGAVRQAARGDLRHRIRMTGPRDEISELAADFDDMLAQLERSFAASTRFASNASHELLTPLATTRAMLDVAIAQQPAAADAQPDTGVDRALLGRLRAMNERSIETAEALLDLAQIETSTAKAEQVDLAQVAAEVAQACAHEAAAKGITVTLDLGPALIDGEPVLARQLLTNLLQNAIRHNAPGGFASVTTGPAGPGLGASVRVENSGPRLEADAVAALAEPFARAGRRPSASSTRGHGLGLSIVSAIVTRFQGDLVLEARSAGGLLVVATFPAR